MGRVTSIRLRARRCCWTRNPLPGAGMHSSSHGTKWPGPWQCVASSAMQLHSPPVKAAPDEWKECKQTSFTG